MPITPVDIDQDIYLKALFYGQPGSGKTRLSASCALDDRTYPCLMVSMVGNPLSVRDYPRRPYIVEITDLKDLNPIYAFFASGQPEKGQLWEALGKPPTEKHPFKALIFDGATNLQRRIMAETVGSANVGPGDMVSAAQQQHHGQVLARMLNVADKFFTLPRMHFIMTALEYEQTDANQNIYYRVQFTGQASGEVPSYAMMVGRLVPRDRIDNKSVGAAAAQSLRGVLEKETDVQQVLFLRGTTRYYAKNQYGPRPSFMLDPTVTDILDALEVPRPEGGKTYGDFIK